MNCNSELCGIVAKWFETAIGVDTVDIFHFNARGDGWCRVDATVGLATTALMYIFSTHVAVELPTGKYQDVLAADPQLFEKLDEAVRLRVSGLAKLMTLADKVRLKLT